MKWNKYTDLALRILVYLVGEKYPVGSAELAKYLDVSQQTVVQSASPLISAGFIDVLPGSRGGYFLGKAPSAITLYEVIIRMETPALFPQHPSGGEINQRVNLLYRFLQHAVDDIFKNMTIQTMAEGDSVTLKQAEKQIMNKILLSLAEFEEEYDPEDVFHKNTT